MSSRWPMVPLGEVLHKSEEWIQLHPDRTYKEVTVRLWGKGATLRKEIAGAEIASSTRLQVHVNQFIISRIDARNGASGLIPEELEGAVVSNDFPVFTPNPNRLDPHYLGWLSKTKSFVELCKAASEGTTNRVRLKEERFLATQIALPPLPEQRRLVERIDALAAKIEEAKGLRASTVPEGTVLMNAARRRLFGEEPMPGWVPLSSIVAEIENGWSPQCESRPVTNGEWGVLKVGAVSFGQFDPKENKALPVGLQPRPEYEVKTGDFIMSRANTLELVGACAVVNQTPPKLMLSDKLFRFHFHKHAGIDTTYLDHVLKSPALRRQIENGASGTSPTMKNISKEKVLGLLIPSHDYASQKDIALRLDEVNQQIEAVTRIQAETSKELDAMLPAILDRAFRGEL